MFHLIKTNLTCVLLKVWSDAAVATGPAVTGGNNEREALEDVRIASRRLK